MKKLAQQRLQRKHKLLWTLLDKRGCRFYAAIKPRKLKDPVVFVDRPIRRFDRRIADDAGDGTLGVMAGACLAVHTISQALA